MRSALHYDLEHYAAQLQRIDLAEEFWTAGFDLLVKTLASKLPGLDVSAAAAYRDDLFLEMAGKLRDEATQGYDRADAQLETLHERSECVW